MYEDSLVDHVKMLNYYIRQYKQFPKSEILAREAQCLNGCQIISATFENPRG